MTITKRYEEISNKRKHKYEYIIGRLNTTLRQSEDNKKDLAEHIEELFRLNLIAYELEPFIKKSKNEKESSPESK